jgi:hypothetical protein
VDNRTIAIIGWHSGIFSHIQFGGGNQLIATPSIVAQVFEAYIGALQSDPFSKDSIEEWFNLLLGPSTSVFPTLATAARKRHDEMAEKDRQRTGSGIQPQGECSLSYRNLPRGIHTTSFAHNSAAADGATAVVPVVRLPFTCHCFNHSSSANLFTIEDQERADSGSRGAGFVWHSTIKHKGTAVACGIGAKRLDARQAAWSTALALALNLNLSLDEETESKTEAG